MAEGGPTLSIPGTLDLAQARRELQALREEAERGITLRIRTETSGAAGGPPGASTFSTEGKPGGNVGGAAIAPQLDLRALQSGLDQMQRMMAQAVSNMSRPIAPSLSTVPLSAAGIQGQLAPLAPTTGGLPQYVQGLPQVTRMTARERRVVESSIEMLERVPPERMSPSMVEALQAQRARLGSTNITPSHARLQAAAAGAMGGPLAEAMTYAQYAPAVGGASGEAMLATSIRRRARIGAAAAKFMSEADLDAPDNIRTSGVIARGAGVAADEARERTRRVEQNRADVERFTPRDSPALSAAINRAADQIDQAAKNFADALNEAARAGRRAAAVAARVDRASDAADLAQERINRRREQLGGEQWVGYDQAFQGFAGQRSRAHYDSRYYNEGAGPLANRPMAPGGGDPTMWDVDMNDATRRRVLNDRRNARPGGPSLMDRTRGAYNFAMYRSIAPSGLYYAGLFGFSQYLTAEQAMENAESPFQTPTQNLQGIMQAQEQTASAMGLGAFAGKLWNLHLPGLPNTSLMSWKTGGKYLTYKDYKFGMQEAITAGEKSEQDRLRFQQMNQTRFDLGIATRPDQAPGHLQQLASASRVATLTAEGDESGVAHEKVNMKLREELALIQQRAKVFKDLLGAQGEVNTYVNQANAAVTATARTAHFMIQRDKQFKVDELVAQTEANRAAGQGAGAGEVAEILRKQVFKQRSDLANTKGMSSPEANRERDYQEAVQQALLREDAQRTRAIIGAGTATQLRLTGNHLQADIEELRIRSGATIDPATGKYEFDLKASDDAGRKAEYEARERALRLGEEALRFEDDISRRYRIQNLQADVTSRELEARGEPIGANIALTFSRAKLAAQEVKERGGPDVAELTKQIEEGGIADLMLIQRQLMNMEEAGSMRQISSGAFGAAGGFSDRRNEQAEEDLTKAMIDATKAIETLRAWFNQP